MTAGDHDVETPDLFAPDSECRARRTARDIIGVSTHTHVCREPVDDHAHHDTAHECTCGYQW